MILNFEDLFGDSSLEEFKGVQELPDKSYEDTDNLYRIDYDGMFSHVRVLELPVLSTTKTGYWIEHPYKCKKKRFVKHNSQFASTSISSAVIKFKQRYHRRKKYLQQDLEYTDVVIKSFDKIKVI